MAIKHIVQTKMDIWTVHIENKDLKETLLGKFLCSLRKYNAFTLRVLYESKKKTINKQHIHTQPHSRNAGSSNKYIKKNFINKINFGTNFLFIRSTYS